MTSMERPKPLQLGASRASRLKIRKWPAQSRMNYQSMLRLEKGDKRKFMKHPRLFTRAHETTSLVQKTSVFLRSTNTLKCSPKTAQGTDLGGPAATLPELQQEPLPVKKSKQKLVGCQGDSKTKAVREQLKTNERLEQNGDIKIEFLLFEVDPLAKGPPAGQNVPQIARKNSLKRHLEESTYAQISVSQVVSNKYNRKSSKRYHFKGKKSQAKALSLKEVSKECEKHEDMVAVMRCSNEAASAIPTKRPYHDLYHETSLPICPDNTKDTRDQTDNIQYLLEQLDEEDTRKGDSPHDDDCTPAEQNELQDNVHQYDNKIETNNRTLSSGVLRLESFKRHNLNVIHEENRALWNNYDGSSMMSRGYGDHVSRMNLVQGRSDAPTEVKGVSDWRRSSSSYQRETTSSISTKSPLPTPPFSQDIRLDTKLSKTDFQLELTNQVHLLRNSLRRRPTAKRHTRGNPNCPMCFSEDGLSDISSFTAGPFDGNLGQIVYSSLSRGNQNPLGKVCSQDSLCYCVDAGISWNSTQVIRGRFSGDSIEGSNQLLPSEIEYFKVMGEVAYLDSYLNVRLLPKTYKLHFPTDLSIILVIAFLFLCVQVLFMF